MAVRRIQKFLELPEVECSHRTDVQGTTAKLAKVTITKASFSWAKPTTKRQDVARPPAKFGAQPKPKDKKDICLLVSFFKSTKPLSMILAFLFAPTIIPSPLIANIPTLVVDKYSCLG